MIRILLTFVSVAVLAACAPVEGDAARVADLGLGERLEADKADGQWGAALTCKTVPNLPRLTKPELYISLNGLTVRLVDRPSGFEKVFPAGVGAIETKTSDLAYGESKTAFPLLATGKSTFEIRPSTIQPCKTWWTDPDTGEKTPVFAGMPFMAFYGGYALHGPIDNYRATNGGNLRRGFVSHGCVRMESQDILEIYARIKGVANIPVRVQREPERGADGSRIDVPIASRFIGAECGKDSDCSYSGGLCKTNAASGRGFCSKRCSGACPDRAGSPTTFCVADPSAAGSGMCVTRRGGAWSDCRNLDHFVPATRSRFGGTAASAQVCVPGTPGWVGDRCRAEGECGAGLRCARGILADGAGVCTQSCTRACADQVARPRTFCAVEGKVAPSGGSCLRQCTPASNAPECPSGFICGERSRPNNGGRAFVCVPR